MQTLETRSSWPRPRSRSALVALSVSVLAGVVGCSSAGTSSSPTGSEKATSQSQAVTAVAPDTILGFESTAGWSLDSGHATSTTIRTQGAEAYAAATSDDHFSLRSANVASTAAGLVGITDPASSFNVDVMLPAGLPGQRYGWVELTVRAPSRGLDDTTLTRVDLAGVKAGQYTTLQFAIPDYVRRALADGGMSHAYDDLSFRIDVHVEADDCDRDSFVYLFDNLRVHSPSTPPPGGGQSIDLVAQLAYSPTTSTPATATFPVGVIQVPQSFHVKLGAAGTGTVALDLGFDGTPSFTCTYAADPGGASYSLASCGSGAKAGDLVSADWARLTIVGGDPTAGTTKIRAQLAENPVGDTLGSNVIPPMPTFWGDTPTDINQIVTAYFDAANATPAKQETWIQAPVPEFAQQSGTGAPYNNLNGPPPPNDPPFDQEGHMNPGGTWDAYWRLNGSLSTSTTNNDNTTHFDAALSVHAVAFGNDETVVSLNTTIDTETGQFDGTSSATGTLELYVFGNDVGGGSASPQTGFNFNLSESDNFDLPPITIWIFDITVGLNATAGVTANGSLSAAGFDVTCTPSASVGAHLEGDVSIGIASGGVSADIQLIKVSTPVSASANWVFNLDPGSCNASLAFDLTGQAQISTLGGNVELEATLGVCPFCWQDSWPLFSWKGIDLGTVPLFNFQESAQIFSFPSSLCVEPITVSITPPSPPVFVGTATTIVGSASLPGVGQQLPQTLPCSVLSWSSSDSADLISYPTDDCNPQFTFNPADLSPRTITANAADAYGDTGSNSITVDVSAIPSTLTAQIEQPANNAYYILQSTPSVQLEGQYLGDAGQTVTLTWTYGFQGTSVPPVLIGTGPLVDWTFPPGAGTYTVTLTATDTVGGSASSSITVTVEQLK